MRQSDSGGDSSSDSDDDSEVSSHTDDGAESSTCAYYGSTLLNLDVIECKIGNKKYRFDKTRGFVEC